MPIKSSDYHMLMDVRSSLIGIAQANKTLENARKQLKTLTSNIASLEKSNDLIKVPEPEYGVHSKKAKEDYEQSVIEERKREAHERGVKQQEIADAKMARAKKAERGVQIAFFLIKFLLILVIGAIAIGSIMICFKGKFGYEFFSNHRIPSFFYGDWDGGFGIGLYLMGVVLLGGIAWLIYDICESGTFAGPIICGIVLIVYWVWNFLFAESGHTYDRGQFWSDAGDWAGGLALSIPYAALVIVVTVVLLVLPTAASILLYRLIPCVEEMLCSQCYSNVPHVNYHDYSESVNLTPFMQTAEYKAAVELDLKEDRIKQERYLMILEEGRIQLKKEYGALAQKQEEIIRKTNDYISSCTSLVKSCPIHDSYKNVHSLNCLLYYFNYDLASTMKEAANLWRNDTKLKQFMGMLQEQHGELMASQRAILAGQNAILAGQDAIRNQIYQANREMAQRWERHEAELQKQHNEKLAAIQHLEREQARISTETRNAIQSATSSIRSSIGDLQTAAHSNTAYIGQQLSSINRTIDRK